MQAALFVYKTGGLSAMKLIKGIIILSAIIVSTTGLTPQAIGAEKNYHVIIDPEVPPITISGHAQNLNILTKSTGLKPETADNPLNLDKKDANLFVSSNRVRIKIELELDQIEKILDAREAQISAIIEYDHKVDTGSFSGRGDSRIAKQNHHLAQAVDLSNSIVDENGVLYEHALYRAYVSLRSDAIDIDMGRQQIPWGVGRFKTPTDVFNSFDFSQLEWDERNGVDAVNAKMDIAGTRVNYVFTPRGEKLHPARHMARITRDIAGYETSIITGRNNHNNTIGYDLQGNIGDAAVRSELLYENARDENDFLRMTFNLDYSFPNGLYALAEYHYNGQGERSSDQYNISRLIKGEIQDLGRNYLGMQFGYDFTPLLRIENSTLINMDDESSATRVELQNSLNDNLMLTLAAIFAIGNEGDEFGDKQNLYLAEMEYAF